jgi:hypothetical protein
VPAVPVPAVPAAVPPALVPAAAPVPAPAAPPVCAIAPVPSASARAPANAVNFNAFISTPRLSQDGDARFEANRRCSLWGFSSVHAIATRALR